MAQRAPLLSTVCLKGSLGSLQMFESEKSHAQQPTKVIIRKSTGEVSLVEQDTIEYVSAAYTFTENKYVCSYILIYVC